VNVSLGDESVREGHQKYRPEVDGLRAIAVLAVVFYHADFKFDKTQILSGGFIGVDVFFVISGYLITSIILKDLNRQSFSFREFYERRVRRIFPALSFVIIISSVFAWVLLVPSSFQEFSASAIASLLFYSNFYFLSLDSYTAEPSAFRPLLHTWSLAVEEQFYLIFPPFLWWINKVSGIRYQNIVLVVLFVLSFCSTQWFSLYSYDANFYLIIGRIWELMSGAFLAINATKLNGLLSRTWQSSMAFVGLLMLLGSMMLLNHHMRHPGIVTIVPVVGAMLLIVFTIEENWIRRILSSTPVVFIGLISYSFYLWHQPVFAFSRLASVDELGYLEKLFLVVFSGLLAVFSWNFVEKPFRELKKISLRKFSAILFFLLFSMMVFFIWGQQTGAVIGSRSSMGLMEDVRRGVISKQGKPCYGNSVNKTCILGDDSKEPNFAVLGDSHALTLSESINGLLKANGASAYLYTMNGCPFIVGILRRSYDRPCDEHVESVFEKISEHGIESVIINDRRNAYILGSMFDNQEGGVERGDPLIYSVKKGMNSPTRKTDVLRLQRKTLIRLFEMGVKVYFILPIPEVGFHVPRTLKKVVGTRRYPLTTNRDLYFKRNNDIFLLVESLKNEKLFVPIFPHQVLCEKVKGRCMTHSDHEVYYTDDNHLSIEGSELVVGTMKHILFPIR
jgi:peptidoglycan/LPS O-acetylase OafA/YrhL